ncbi:WD40-repeat-containing domain protein [Gongronella butleri]|nr:WD40-repeat-containing domain protein [Gongronella butleri]
MHQQGVDFQGIIWPQQPITRHHYRNQRMMTYETYYSLSRDKVETCIKNQPVKSVYNQASYYQFRHAKLQEPCRIGHFQLRNLLWAPTKNNVFYIHGNTVRQWSPQRRASHDVLNLEGLKTNYCRVMSISSMACKDDVLFVGGFLGDYFLQRLDDMATPHYGLISHLTTGIVNHADMIHNRQGARQVLVSDNDMVTRFLDVQTFRIAQEFALPFPVNCSAITSNGQMMCAVGDSTETHLMDVASGKKIKVLDDHFDYSFTCCFSPNDRTLATGNQDKTTRIYDIRNLSQSLHVLGGNVGAIRSLHYSSDGKHLVMAEPIDFVHIFDTQDYASSQVIDFFGDIAGVALTPDDQSLYIANNDKRVGGLYEFSRVNPSPLFFI